MPVMFIVDQALPADVRTITLSYTLFDVTDLPKSDQKTEETKSKQLL